MSGNSRSLAPTPPLRGRSVFAWFKGGLLSSNSGASLPRVALYRMGIAERLASRLADRRGSKRAPHGHAAISPRPSPTGLRAESLRFREFCAHAGGLGMGAMVSPAGIEPATI